MDEALRVLEETESLLTQAEKNLKKLELLELEKTAERIVKAIDKIKAIKEKIRDQKIRLMKALMRVSVKTEKFDYLVGKRTYSVFLDNVRLNMGRGTHQSSGFGDFISNDWSYELCHEIIRSVGDHLSKLPAEQEAQAEEIRKLTEISARLAKISS